MKDSSPRKSSRKTKDIKWARFVERPSWAHESTEKGVIAKGIKYEKKVFENLKKLFPQAMSGPWVEFVDSTGKQWAQPDVVLITQDKIYCIEVKLTYKDSALRKLDKFYKPLLEKIFSLPIQCIMVYRNSKPNSSWAINSLEEAEKFERIYTWHMRL